MGVESGHTRVGELLFRVYQRALHPDWFATRAHRRLAHKKWTADVRIVDGGHAITWSAGESRVSEVLSASDTALPDLGQLFRSPVRHERSTSLAPGGGIQYQVCFEAERVDRLVFSHVCDELVLDASDHCLIHRARASNRMAPQPLSYIWLDATTRRLSVFCVHTFPDELALVRTQSLFELASSDSG